MLLAAVFSILLVKFQLHCSLPSGALLANALNFLAPACCHSQSSLSHAISVMFKLTSTLLASFLNSSSFCSLSVDTVIFWLCMCNKHNAACVTFTCMPTADRWMGRWIHRHTVWTHGKTNLQWTNKCWAHPQLLLYECVIFKPGVWSKTFAHYSEFGSSGYDRLVGPVILFFQDTKQ